MADIDVERKSGNNWIWWVLGLIVLALLLWWLIGMGDDDDVDVDPVTATAVEPITPATTPEVVGTAPGISIADILGTPASYLGQPWQIDAVNVVEVPTDRGFWIEDEGARMYVILIDDPAEEPLDINPGQSLRIDQGVLRDRTYLPQIPGEPLDAQTQQTAEEQPIFLTVDERNIEILQAGTPQPGTDPAQTAPGT